MSGRRLTRLIVCTALVVVPLLVSSATSSATSPPMSSYATAAQVMALVKGSLPIDKIPSDATPKLTVLMNDGDWGGDLQAKSKCPELAVQASVFKTSYCYYGDTRAKFTVAIIGDSRAQMLLDMMNTIAGLEHFRILLLAKVGCPAPLATYETDNEGSVMTTSWTACTAFHANVEAALKTVKPAVIIISSTLHLYVATPTPHQASPTEMGTDLSALLAALPAASYKVVLGGFPSPAPDANPTECLSIDPSNVAACGFEVNSARVAEYAEAKTVSDGPKDVYLNQEPFFCDVTCPAIIGHYVPYTIDASHADKTYYGYLTGAMWYLMKPSLVKAGWKS
jgi:hypothetical protein